MKGWEYNGDTGELYYVSDTGVTQGDSAIAAILGTATPNASQAAAASAQAQTNYVLGSANPAQASQVAQSANTFLSSYGWLIGIAGIATLLMIGGGR